MKALILSLCTLTGVIDVHDNGVAAIVISSPIPDVEPEIVTITNEYLPPLIKEGDRVNFTVLADQSLQKYCHNQL